MAGLTAIPGVRVGVAGDPEAATGVTVVLVEEGARAAVEVRGSAPGTRETALLGPGQLVREVQAILLAGGSAFGLEAAGGVMRYLEERGRGFPVGSYRVPIVPAAILFDLFTGDGRVRPDAEMGYRACLAATDGPVAEGSVGAGTGATVGKYYGPARAVKGGQGSAALSFGRVIVAALVVVNAFGDVYDAGGELLAGPRHPETNRIESTAALLLQNGAAGEPGNTTLAVVATNAAVEREGLLKMAQMAHDGLARRIWPVHTMWDGDTIFALSRGEENYEVSLLGLAAAEAVALAVERAVRQAHGLAGIPAVRDLVR